MTPKIIKNFDQLATSSLRKNALEILNAGLEAIQADNVLSQKIKLEGQTLTVDSQTFDLNNFERIHVVGIGKASLKTAQFLENILGDKITDGVIIDTQSATLNHIQSFVGTHPIPSEQNIIATKQLEKTITGLSEKDLVIAIISGGGSALLTDPVSLEPEQLKQTFDALLKSGADISEMNVLRKHISNIHGGNLAKLAYPATVIGLIFSDIPYSDLSIVASGPTYIDRTTTEDAKKILEKYQLENLEFVETPKDQKYFDKVSNILIVGNTLALSAMDQKAKSLGYNSKIFAHDFKSDANAAGETLLKELTSKKTAVIVGGETTVKVTGSGKGGRNQQLALASLAHIKPGQLILSCASDGKDNIEEAAGALADEQTIQKMTEKNLDPHAFLKENDSYNFFVNLGDLIITGLTGSNVSDLILVIND